MGTVISEETRPGRPAKGKFVPSNPQKYLGANVNNISYRSSWEVSFMQVCDNNEAVIGWMSESLPSNTIHKGISGIPYYNPITKKNSLYIPDFFIIYVDRNKKQHVEVIEIKPLDEVPGFRGKVNKIKQARQAINAMKYKAAIIFCNQRGWFFRIMTEKQLFLQPARK